MKAALLKLIKHKPSLWWWFMVLACCGLLKQHYSIASAEQLQWMLQPLAHVLSLFSELQFTRDTNFEWVDALADIRLVKGCAGINFMVMSLMLYAWLLKPDYSIHRLSLLLLLEQLVLLCTALVSAWATALLANSLRIVFAASFQQEILDSGLLSQSEDEIHKVIGMMVYYPMLSLQILMGNPGSRKFADLAPLLLYAIVMIVIPLVTGNAFQNGKLFMQHALQVIAAALCMILLLRVFASSSKKLAQLFATSDADKNPGDKNA